MYKDYTKIVQKLLTPKQKGSRINVCVELLNNIDNDLELIDRVITCNESWFFTYDPETKH